MFVGALLGGMAAGWGAIGPSEGDVIDYDEYLTGERKEGSASLTNFVFKSATGIMLLVTGFVLQFSDLFQSTPDNGS